MSHGRRADRIQATEEQSDEVPARHGGQQEKEDREPAEQAAPGRGWVVEMLQELAPVGFHGGNLAAGGEICIMNSLLISHKIFKYHDNTSQLLPAAHLHPHSPTRT